MWENNKRGCKNKEKIHLLLKIINNFIIKKLKFSRKALLLGHKETRSGNLHERKDGQGHYCGANFHYFLLKF